MIITALGVQRSFNRPPPYACSVPAAVHTLSIASPTSSHPALSWVVVCDLRKRTRLQSAVLIAAGLVKLSTCQSLEKKLLSIIFLENLLPTSTRYRRENKIRNALSPFKLKTINASMASSLNFQLHQRVDDAEIRVLTCLVATCSSLPPLPNKPPVRTTLT